MSVTPRAARLFSCAALFAVSMTPPLFAADTPQVVQLPIPEGHVLLQPILSDRRLDGELGRQLASVAERIALQEPGAGPLTTLRKDNEGRWVDAAGVPYRKPLPPGHGLVVTRTEAGAASVTFTGIPDRVACVIEEGRNLIGSSSTLPVSVQQAVTSSAPNAIAASYDEQKADCIDLLNEDGSWQRLIRTPDQVWMDLRTFTPATLFLQPGRAFYYIRQPGQGPLVLDF